MRAAPLILDYEPSSCTFQDVGQAIGAGSSILAWIDVSKLGFLARRNLPPIPRPILQNSLPVALPFPQAPPDVAAIPAEEVASSRLSLEEEINKFHSKEEENPRALIVNISDVEGETDRYSGVHLPTLVIVRLDNSYKEEEEKMALNKGNKSLMELMAA